MTFQVVHGMSTVFVNILEFQYSVCEKLFSWQNVKIFIYFQEIMFERNIFKIKMLASYYLI